MKLTRYFHRLRKRTLLKGCLLVGAIFLLYQLLMLVALSEDTKTGGRRVHPRDFLLKKELALRKNAEVKAVGLRPVMGDDTVHKYAAKYNAGSDPQKPIAAAVSKVREITTPSINFITNKSPPGTKFFTCQKSGLRIDSSKVNDDYCDCPEDGSDEPLTNACSGMTFRCPKLAPGFARELSSSFLNDGICDCCDGADEWAQHPPPLKLEKKSLDKLLRHKIVHAPCPDLCS